METFIAQNFHAKTIFLLDFIAVNFLVRRTQLILSLCTISENFN